MDSQKWYCLKFFILFYFLITVRCEFVAETFNVEPLYATVGSQMVLSVQVTHPPGPLLCEHSLIDKDSLKTISTTLFISGVTMMDLNLKKLPFKVFFSNTLLTKPYYIINYSCKYYCGNQQWHYIQKKGYLIVKDSPILPNYHPNNNFINDNTKEILDFVNTTSTYQIEILNKTVKEFVNKTDNPNNYLQKSILISEYFSVSDCLTDPYNQNCLEYIKNTQEIVINKISQILDCAQVEKTIFNDPIPEKILSLSATSLAYQSSNYESYMNRTLFKLSNISHCLSSNGFRLLDKLKSLLTSKEELFKNVTQDYLNSISITSSNNLQILNNLYKNTTTEKNDSLIVDENTLKIKHLVEENSLLLSKNNFIDITNDTLESENLIFLNKKYTKKEQGSLRLLYDNIGYESFIINNNSTKINVSLPINYMMSKYKLEAVKIGAILYNKYPLLSGDNKNYSEKIISLKLFNNSDQSHTVEGLMFPINIIFDRPDPSYKFCLYYNSNNKTWDNKNCKSINLTETQILCQCNHLTDFTVSNFNPIYIYEDIINIISDTNWMTDFEEFDSLNAENAIVLYIYSLLLILYFMGLFFTIRYDSKRDCIFYDKTHMERPGLCDRICSKKKIVNDLVNIKFQTDNILIPVKKKKIIEYYQKISDVSLISDEDVTESSYKNRKRKRLTIVSEKIKFEDNLQLEFDNIIECSQSYEISEFKKNLYESFKIDNENTFEKEEEQIEKNLIFIEPERQTNLINEDLNLVEKQFVIAMTFYQQIYAVIKVLRFNNIYTALFSDINYKLNKTDTLTLIFFNITTAFAICGLFSPFNSKSGNNDETSYGYKFFDRSLAVSIMTLIILHIPTKIISLIIKKQEVYRGETKTFSKKLLAIGLKFFFYLTMAIVFFSGLINTTWIYLRNRRIERDNVFISYFFTTLIVKLVVKFIIFFATSGVIYIIIRSSRVPTWKIFIILVSVLLTAIS